MIETIVESISINLVTRNRVVLLKEVNGTRHLPIWIGDFEAHAIAMELQSAPSPRPMPYDLMKTMVADLDGVDRTRGRQRSRPRCLLCEDRDHGRRAHD